VTDTPSGSLHRGLVGDKSVRFLAVEARALAEHTRHAHGLGPHAAKAAGEATIAALLMSAWIKGEERITLQLQSEDPRFAYMGEVDAEGRHRARLTPGTLRMRKDGTVQGLMMAIKADAKKEIYRGITPLEGQTIEHALVGHLSTSDQVDIILRIQVVLKEDGSVRTAGGLLVERLPEDPSQPSISQEEFHNTYAAIPHQDIADLHTALAFGKIANLPVELLENRVLSWHCACSHDKVEGMLMTLGQAELQSILDDLGQAEVTCHYCNTQRVFDSDALKRLLANYDQAEAPEA
jgi:molecular chaperone Hsp33